MTFGRGPVVDRADVSNTGCGLAVLGEDFALQVGDDALVVGGGGEDLLEDASCAWTISTSIGHRVSAIDGV